MNIVIIGATKGLGLCLAELFLEKGHNVAAGILERAIPLHIRELQKVFSKRLLVFQADVTNEKEIEAGAKTCNETMGKVDALCNVAGVIFPSDKVKKLHECEIGILRETFDVNVFGAIITLKHFFPIIKEGGKFITVTSEGVGVKNPGDWIPCYALSKTVATKVSGIMNLVTDDVDFYSIHPGRMNTEMGRQTAQIEPEESAEGFYRIITGEVPVSRDNWYINYKGETMDA